MPSRMGKNTNKPVHKSQLGGGSGGGFEEAQEKPFHSKEYEQAQLDALLHAKERPTWDEFKAEQRRKGELEGAEARAEEEAQRKFREELDVARNARLGAAEQAEEQRSKKKKKKKHGSKKHKKENHKEGKKKKKRRRSSSSSSDDSDDSDSSHKKKSRKHKREQTSGKADGPVSLRAFFAGSSSEDSD